MKIHILSNKKSFPQSVKGLAMIFDGQENSLIIFRRKEIYM